MRLTIYNENLPHFFFMSDLELVHLESSKYYSSWNKILTQTYINKDPDDSLIAILDIMAFLLPTQLY